MKACLCAQCLGAYVPIHPRTTEAPHVNAGRKWGETRRKSPRSHGRQPVMRGSQPQNAGTQERRHLSTISVCHYG